MKRLTHPEGLPRADHAIVECVHNMEDVRLLETHLALVCLVVVEVRFDVEGVAALELKMSVDFNLPITVLGQSKLCCYLSLPAH